MKKIIFATAVAFATSFGAYAQIQPEGHGGPSVPTGPNCTGCTALTYGTCQTSVTVSLANVLEMSCDNCGEMQACANSISEWTNGISLGTAEFSVASTKPYSVYAGTASASMSRSGGGSIGIGTGANQISINAKVENNSTNGSTVSPYSNAPTPISVRSGVTATTAGSKLIAAAPASLIKKGAKVSIKTGKLPVNVASGDYSVDVVFAAIQD